MSAPPCPNCGSDETSYGEYGAMCQNDKWTGDTMEECPVIFFKDQ